MSIPVALGLDLGTTSLAAVAVSADGRIVAQATRLNPGRIDTLPPGRAAQDPLRIRSAAVELLRELGRRGDLAPQCLGLTGQMHGGLLLDERRRPLTPLITWQDRRATEPANGEGETWLARLLARCPEEAVERTGCRPAPGYLGTTLFILRQTGEIPTTARAASGLADWLAAELCDGIPVTDRSQAAAFGLYDLARDAWSPELLDAVGVSTNLLPEVRTSGAPQGGLTAELAQATGLPAGLPVCVPVGDNQAAVLGSVPAGDPAIQINIGTGGQINWPVERFQRVLGMDTRYLPQGRFFLVGAGVSGGDAYAWVQRTASAWLAACGATLPAEEVYERINELAADVPDDADGLVCRPVFRGTRREPHARGEFHGVTPDNFTLGHVGRAVLNGLADGLHEFYAQAGPAQPAHLGRIIGSGNALRRNPLLQRILAARFARDLWTPAHEEEAAYGAALLAGSETGVWPDLAAAGKNIQLVRAATARPQP